MAIAAHERMAARSPAWSCFLGQTYARAGRTGDARRILHHLEARPPSPWNALSLAQLYSTLGDHDRALQWLAYEEPNAWVAWFATSLEPEWEPYRTDPRYQALIRRMNLRYDPTDRLPVQLPALAPPLPDMGDVFSAARQEPVQEL